MRKLITFSSFFALLVLFLAGCQNSSNITSPENNLDKKPTPPPVYVYDCDPTALKVDGTVTVDLVAGQFNPVGTATFTLHADGKLDISYTLDSGVGSMSEIHVDFATTRNNDAANGGFHANSQGSPQPGHFDINTTASGSSWNTTVSKADLLSYLNLAPGSVIPDFYIAAHGVVNYEGAGTCPTLPNGKWRWLTSVPGTNYYVENAKLYEQPDQSSSLLYTLNGWCVDRENGAKGGQFVQVDFHCSTDQQGLGCFVDLPDNMGAANWVLNHKVVSGVGYAPYRTVQVVLWKLLDTSTEAFSKYDTSQVNALYAEALLHKGFVPQCGDIIGVIMYEEGVDYCSGQSGMQAFLIERPVECGSGGSDTMWGFNFDDGAPVSGESCRFVDPGNWARYFQF